jgi:HEAT repeat protein
LALSEIEGPKWAELILGGRLLISWLRNAQDKRVAEVLIDMLGNKRRTTEDRIAAGDALDVNLLDRELSFKMLIGLLGDEEKFVRSIASQKIGSLGDKRAVDILIEVLKDESNTVRESAAKALGYLGDGRAVGPLAGLLSDENRDIRSAAADALGNIGDKRAVDHLIIALESPPKRQLEKEGLHFLGGRYNVAIALGKLGDHRAVSYLTRSLEDADPDVRKASAWSLKELAKIGDKS